MSDSYLPDPLYHTNDPSQFPGELLSLLLKIHSDQQYEHVSDTSQHAHVCNSPFFQLELGSLCRVTLSQFLNYQYSLFN